MIKAAKADKAEIAAIDGELAVFRPFAQPLKQ